MLDLGLNPKELSRKKFDMFQPPSELAAEVTMSVLDGLTSQDLLLKL